MTDPRIPKIAESLYEIMPDREFVKTEIYSRIWKASEKDIDAALDAIESKIQSTRGQTITFNDHKGKWIMDDFNKLKFVREDDNYDAGNTNPDTHDPLTLDKDEIWKYIVEKNLDTGNINEEEKKTLIEQELEIRKTMALFLHYIDQIANNEDALKKLFDLIKPNVKNELNTHAEQTVIKSIKVDLEPNKGKQKAEEYNPEQKLDRISLIAS